MNLTTTYLGLKLASPLIIGSSPLSDDNDSVRRLIAHGVSAIVMHSLFQEQIAQDAGQVSAQVTPPANGFHLPPHVQQQHYAHTPAQYLRRIDELKTIASRSSKTHLPVIAYLNCSCCGDWAKFAARIESAGADALELNIYTLPTDPGASAADVEQNLIDIVTAVRHEVRLPVAVKLSPFYSSMPHLARQLETAGATGLVLFNRFYQPDFEIKTHKAANVLELSHMTDPMELRLRLHWLAILSAQSKLAFALTGGVHTGLDAIKGIMAGAHAIQIVSALLSAGPEYLDVIRDGLVRYMEALHVDSVEELRGCMNHSHAKGPSAEERRDYVAILHKWSEQKAAPEGLHAY